MSTALITLTRSPARIASGGAYALPGFPDASYTVGHDAVLDFDHASLPLEIAVDIEGAGLTPRARLDVKSVQIGDSNHSLIFDPRDSEQYGRIRQILNSGRRLVVHNSPFDVPILYMIGLLDMDSIDLVTDTLIWARLANPDEKTPKGLMHSANRHLGLSLKDPLKPILKTLGWSKARWYLEGDLNIPNYRNMAAADTVLTHRLRPVVEGDAYARLTEDHPFTVYGVTGAEAAALVQREQILNRDTLRRTCLGIRVDLEFLDGFRSEFGATMSGQRAELERLGITPGYSGSLTKWLEENGELPEDYPRTPTTKQPSGVAKDLEMLDHPTARLFVSNKKSEKIEKDYLSKTADHCDQYGRIHPAMNYLLAATGRGSMDTPPIHQFPPGARGLIVPDDYEAARGQRQSHELLYEPDGIRVAKEVCHCRTPKGFTSIDWSQIEPCLAANVAGDLELLAGYESGLSDLYTGIAMFANVKRKVAKIIVLAQLYGEGLRKLARDLGHITGAEALAIGAEYDRRQKSDPLTRVSHAQIAEELGIHGFAVAISIRDRVFSAMPHTVDLMAKMKHIAENERMVFTLSGRILPIPSGWYKGRFSVESHKGINYFCQGGAYDILADALLRIHHAGLAEAVYFSMHDELIVASEAAHDIRRIMETPPERLCFLSNRVPVLRTDTLHLGERWGVDA